MRMKLVFVVPEGRPESEANDCVVRALSLAAPMDYVSAHSLLADWGRKPRGFTYDTFGFLLNIGAKRINDGDGSAFPRMMTVGRFAKSHPTGRYFIRTRGHAVAVCDGRVLDSFDSSRRFVLSAWII